MAAAPPVSKRYQRPLQDFCAWPNFLTAVEWGDIQANPVLASEIILQFMNLLGLVCPTEGTVASLASAILVCAYGQMSLMVNDREIDRIYQSTKHRIKSLYKKEPQTYIVLLPPCPAMLLRQSPEIARKVYTAGKLPMSCPLSTVAISAVASRITMRGGKRGGWKHYGRLLE